MESSTSGRGNRGRARGSPPQQDAPASIPPRPPQGVLGGRPGGPLFQGPSTQQGPTSAFRPQPLLPTCWAPRPVAPVIIFPPVMMGRGFRRRVLEDRLVTEDTVQVQQGPEVHDNEIRGCENSGVRRRTKRNEIVNTKPAQFTSKKGVDGRTIGLRANYFQLMSDNKWGLKEYRVDFSPPVEDTKARKKLVANGIKPFNVTGYLFDGTVLYTPNRLHPEPCEFVSEDETSQQNIKVEIRLVGEVHQGDYHYVQLFSMIIRKCLSYMDLEMLGRNHYDPNLKASIRQHDLELWRGFTTSIRRYEKNIMLNVDLAIKVLRRKSLFDMLLECRASRDPKQEYLKQVIGAIVLTEYNNKTYRIDDVDFEKNANDTFTKRDGTQISYWKYFQKRYNVNIRCKEQPLLLSKSRACEIRAGMPEHLVLLPELCLMTGLSEKQRGNFQLLKAMREYTHVGPGGRMCRLQEFVRRLRACPTALEEIRRWDLELATNLIEFQGRVLPVETLLLGNNQQIQGGEKGDWTRSMRGAPMYKIVNIQKLAIIVPARLAEATREFGELLSKIGNSMSMSIKSELFAIPNDRTQMYLSEIQKVDVEWKPDMVMVVLSTNSADKYNAVKKKCYLDNALPCQVVLARNLNCKNVMSIATKVVIQMNCKMGGAPWATILPKNTMVVGYDVCRDTYNKFKSFAGMVASMDQACTQYYSMATQNDIDQELGPNISRFMLLACKQYQQRNKVIPDRIIIYRGEVAGEQIPYVKENEVESIKTKLAEELYKDVPLKMAFIVVSERIGTKIFRSQACPRNYLNPPMGTVVDDVITWPERYDFYIVSHCPPHGIISPTSYNIIEDTLGVDANRIQRFTFKMCHMYFNSSRTVREPAPCRYAHKLAFLIANSLHRPALPALNNTFYYL